MRLERKKICIFCGDKAETKDHIPSKNLLEKPYPNNLFTVPSCKRCNNSFSSDEEYFLNVLSEISANQTLLSKKAENGSIFRARENSRGLKALIQNSFVGGEDGSVYFQANLQRINRVIEKNAAGLYFLKYKVAPQLHNFKCTGFYPYTVIDLRPSEVILLTHSEKFIPKKWTIVQKNVFSYIIVRNQILRNKLIMILDIHNTAWSTIEVPLLMPNYRKKAQLIDSHQLKLSFIPSDEILQK